MAFRQVARKPEIFNVNWGEQFDVFPWTEDKTEDIAQFLLNTGTRSFAELSECANGTPQSARHYVTRARKYVQKELHGDEVGYAASSLVYDKTKQKLIAICLCCGCSVYHIEVHPAYQRQGIATRMLKRALTVHAERGSPELHLWRHDDSPGVQIYASLGFVPTGRVE